MSMTPRLTVETFCFAPAQLAQTLASPSTVRWSLAVDSTIDRAGVHRRRPQGQAGQPSLRSLASVGSGMAAGLPLRAPSSARTSEPSDLFDPYVT